MTDVLVGIDGQLQTLRDWLKNWSTSTKRCAILYGPQGVGKTSSVYKIAGELGYSVVEFNASKDRTSNFFRLELQPILTTEDFIPTLVLLDEFEDVGHKSQRELARLLTKTTKPVIITTNDINTIIGKIRTQSIEIYYPLPSLQSIVQYVKLKGANINIQTIKDIRDFRQLKMIIEYGSHGYNSEPTQKQRILKALNSGDYSNIQPEDLPILLDNSVHLQGVKLWEFIAGLAAYDLCKLPQALNGVKVGIREQQYQNVFYPKLLESRKGGR